MGMAEMREGWHARIARLDGGRERRIVGFGAMVLLIVLSVGPTVVNALAETITAHTPPPEVHMPPQTIVTIMTAPTQDATSVTEQTVASPVETTAVTPTNSAIPPLAFLFPQNGAALGGPITIAVRLESATAVAMIFEITSLSGETLQMLPATPGTTGEWSALLSAEPGEYVVKPRASLDDGRVVTFKEQRTFTLTETVHAAAPADPSEPLVELSSPDSSTASWDEVVPLAARVKHAEPNALVFIVTAPDESETLVLGAEAASHGYWTGMFQGAAGTYHVRARATVGTEEYFSNENIFTLQTPAG